MGKETWKITLADGTSLEGLHLNGNNFISDVEVSEETFADNLGMVVATSSAGSRIELENAELVQITPVGTEYWFVLRQKTTEEIEKEKTAAQLETMMEAIDMLLMGEV